jgi:hypothetical protein
MIKNLLCFYPAISAFRQSGSHAPQQKHHAAQQEKMFIAENEAITSVVRKQIMPFIQK